MELHTFSSLSGKIPYQTSYNLEEGLRKGCLERRPLYVSIMRFMSFQYSCISSSETIGLQIYRLSVKEEYLCLHQLKNRGQFGSKLGFILSAAGSAVGLGNIWKFPGKAYFCGGGAFLIIYLIIVALVGTTVMMAEFTVGRKTHKNAVGAMRELNAKWSWVGGLGVLTGFIILCYYCQVGGWAMKYIVAYIVDVKTIWADPTAYFLNNLLGADGTFPLQGAVIFPFIFLFLTAYIISHGTAGIEKMSKLLMPLLFIMLIALMIRSCTLPGADDGLKYMLNVDFSTINGVAILTALGQAFFSLSLGMGRYDDIRFLPLQ